MRGTQNLAADAPVECQRDGFVVSTDRARLDLHSAHEFLAGSSYRARQIPFDTFARVIGDLATFAYVADVFVLDSHRARGLGKLLMGCIQRHPQLQGLRRWVLTTRDAHGLYAQFGFASPKFPERYMEILRPNLYETL